MPEIIKTLESAIDHFVRTENIDEVHKTIHQTLDPRTASPLCSLLDAEEQLLSLLVPDVPEPELIAPGVKGYWVAHRRHFVGVPYTETEWPRTYIFQCCVYTVMENTADA